MKKVFKNWNLFEILFLSCSVTAIIVCFIVGKDKNYLSLVTSILGITAILCTAKGIVYAPILEVVYCVLYIIISFTQKYYGEAIIYTLTMPIAIAAVVSWLKHKNKDNENVVEINRLKAKEWLYLSICTIACTFGFYFLLKALNTNELIISTISLITSAFATYLQCRRCKYYALAYLVNDVILITLWSIAAASNIAFLPTVISFCVFFINDIYGYIRWSIGEKKQLKEKSQLAQQNNENKQENKEQITEEQK